MNKIVLRTALISIAALAATAIVVFAGWLLCSPQTMATACERTGNYSFAVTCADLHYKYTKSVASLARCFEDGILAGKDGLTVEYGEKLVEDKDFERLCADKDKLLSGSEYGKYAVSYKNYVCGNLAVAHYRTGSLQKAVERAKSGGIKSFNKLVIAIAEGKDSAAARSVLTALGELEQTEEVAYLSRLLKNYTD